MTSNQKFTRTIQELREFASMFWPSELSQKEAELSIIPKLLETQDQFISILKIDVPGLDELFQIIDSSKFPGNLFLKHLVVLADFGGEPLKQFHSTFDSMFPDKRMGFVWNGKEGVYEFETLPLSTSLTNTKLGISGKKLLVKEPLSDLHKDVIAFLMFGSLSNDEEISGILSKCEIGILLGKPDDIEKYIKQRYIWVSRITGGAQANTLGQLAQSYVHEYLQEKLDIEGISVKRNGSMPNITDRDSQQNISRPAKFDVVVSDGKKYIGIEVSFQVTTNSTIERKANQAKPRYEQIKNAGFGIAYVIDGAGNFQRESAIRTLCSNSNCTVAFSDEELDVLCEYIRLFF